MSQFCKEEKNNRRCVLYVNHEGGCSLQSKNSAAVRQIEQREETEKKLKDI